MCTSGAGEDDCNVAGFKNSQFFRPFIAAEGQVAQMCNVSFELSGKDLRRPLSVHTDQRQAIGIFRLLLLLLVIGRASNASEGRSADLVEPC